MTYAKDTVVELRRLLDEVSAMSDSDKALMESPLKHAVAAIGGGVIQVAIQAMEHDAGSLANDVVLKAAASARLSAAAVLEAPQPAPRASSPLPSRRFKPEMREDKYGNIVGQIKVAGVMSVSSLRTIQTEMITFGEGGKRYWQLLIDFSAAKFDMDDEDWIDFSRSWLAAQPSHLGLGYVVREPSAFAMFDRLADAGVNRGRINLLWKHREDSVCWLGF